MNTPIFVIDTETYLIDKGSLAPKLVSLCYQRLDKNDIDGKVRLIPNSNPRQMEKACTQILSGKYRVAGHNVAYDLAVIGQTYPSLLPYIFELYERGMIIDTLICNKLAYISKGWLRNDPTGRKPKFSLSALAKRHLSIDMEGKSGEDIWRLRYAELDGVPLSEWPQEAQVYARDDVRITGRLVRFHLPGWSRLPTIELQHYAAWALHLMSCWGIRTDPARVQELEEKLLAQKAEYDEVLIQKGVVRKGKGSKNMTVVKELVARAYAVDGRVPPKTDKGAVKTDRRTLEESHDALLIMLAESGKTAKLINTFLPVLNQGADGPIHPRYNVLVDSGRTSSSSPNVQQLPRKGGVRECFVPREGWVYVAADYHVAELCSLAQVIVTQFGYSKMADALNAGKDLHIATAATVLNITYGDALDKYRKGDTKVKDARQTAKILNFGLPGGLSTNGLRKYAKAFGRDLTYREADELRNKWMAVYPEMKGYFQWISDMCGVVGEFTSTHPVSGYIRGGVGYTEGANHMFQHLTATACKRAMTQVARQAHTDTDSPLFNARPVLFIHDEIILEVREAQAPEAAERLEQVMNDAMRHWLPDVSCTAEAHIMRRWYKDAEPVRVNGTLVPWEPS